KVLTSGKYFGTLISSLKAGSIQLSESKYAANEILPQHSHEFPFFCYVLAGGFSETQHDRTTLHKTGAIIFHPSGDLHADSFINAPSRCFSIEFSSKTVHDITLAIQPWSSNNSEVSFLARRIFREFKHPDSLSALAIEGLSLELIAAAMRALQSKEFRHIPDWLEKVRNKLQEEFRQTLSFERIASEAGVHPVHLARSFRRFYGTTVAEFIRSLRIQNACTLLRRGHSILEVALSLGFCDQSHFTKTFRRFLGMTPREYRKLH
ncbi:MAG TPA: AraC family transcriptional regulator, partial [Acidobacteriota bacterium]|nr:AraC family transcriptional regulator [Acidobacteriota bacterium]